MNQNWHPASRPQFVMVLSGAIDETSDGQKRWSSAGELFLADDTLGQRTPHAHVGGRARGLFAHLPSDATIA